MILEKKLFDFLSNTKVPVVLYMSSIVLEYLHLSSLVLEYLYMSSPWY